MSKEKPTRTTKRMASIARRINASYCVRRLFGDLILDIGLIAGTIALFAVHFVRQLPEEIGIKEWHLNASWEKKELILRIISEKGTKYVFNYEDVLYYLSIAMAVLLFIQLLTFFFGLLQTNLVRRKLRPLNELAIKAEEVSRLAYDPSKMMDLTHAIENVSPDSEDVSIYTGDKDLQSIEIALNNLLRGMKESEKRQMRFVDDASHELRTPIAVILGYVNMLDRWGKNDEETLEEGIEAIKNESTRMKELVDQLLFLARGDNGRNHLNIVDVDMSQLVEEVYEESMMIDENHMYRFVPFDGAKMRGDVTLLKQSLRILVQNAAKYSLPHSEIRFSVGKTENQIWYRVQDEGYGMEEQEIVHIFERFYRSDAARNSETGGSGLGLSIAKWIVDAHKGTIEVMSRPDLGTRFTVSFPMQMMKEQ